MYTSGDFEIAAQAYQQSRIGGAIKSLFQELPEPNAIAYSGRRARGGRIRGSSDINSDSKYETGLFQLITGRLELLNGRLPKALPALKAARGCFREDEREAESIWSAVWLAAAEQLCGDLDSAREAIRAAIPDPNRISHAAVLAARQARPWLNDLRRDAELKPHLRGLFEKVDRLEVQLPPIRRQLRRLAHTIEMPTPSLVIRGFGAGQVWVDGKLLNASDWQTQSVRELFFYFLAASRPLSRADWRATLAGHRGRASSGCVQNEIYRLRRVGQEAIISTAKPMLPTLPWIIDMT
jgi:hypothetical protein